MTNHDLRLISSITSLPFNWGKSPITFAMQMPGNPGIGSNDGQIIELETLVRKIQTQICTQFQLHASLLNIPP